MKNRWQRWRAALAGMVTIFIVTAALSGGVSAARADVVDPSTAPSVRSISYNVCGADDCQSPLDTADWVAALRQQVTDWNADAVMLQELCIGQWIGLRSALRDLGYQAVWTSTLAASGCAKWDASGDNRYGLGVFVKAATADRYVANLTVPTGQEPRAVLCARAVLDGRATLACSTHLAQYIKPDNGSSEMMGHVDQWAAGLPVIIGADVNGVPTSPATDPIRVGLPGTGSFAEVDENDRQYFTQDCLDAAVAACRSGEPTSIVGGIPKKFDHIFLSAQDFHTVRGDAVEPGLSDHLLLRGAAWFETRPGSAVAGDLSDDGRADLVAVDTSGALRLYPGIGNGRLLNPYRAVGTSGWTDALVGHRGDWTGDGHEDVVAKIGDNLWVYPNSGSGALGSRVAMGGRPNAWSTTRQLALPGDFTGDGYPDLLAQSSTGLWLHAGAPATKPGVSTSAPLHIGGVEWADLDVLAPGDVDGDGRVDLWARERSTGQLWLYRNAGGTGLLPRQQASTGTWSSGDRPLVVSPGDANGDGLADLWATTDSGDLLLHLGTAGGFGPAGTIGTGGWSGILRMS
ncbi:endonuclease/exonuclease/phosphatase family metal-dependent hydrolase [Micromonospora taraxaci]|uniref:Endonuclease/exonuclease/phosphatase family metal-dependent hydrolase n=2 Tax=Micromonospora taraxaci TaxID=1316803 RepID=A0A561VX85_9ACTN|nr:endonuclease/exonuclease/phosphatase family metal-dependent hydrolase [Micromonospora taraxaci]